MVVRQSHATQVKRPLRRRVLSACREGFEKVGGVIGAVGGVAGSLLPSTLVGMTEGIRRVKHPEVPADAEQVAYWVTVGTAVQALAPSAALGYWAAGAKGAAVALGGQGAGAVTGILMFARGGSADLVGKGLAADFNACLEGETSEVRGALKGLGTGFVSGVKYNAQAGWHEGEGAFSGLVEGVRAIPESFRSAGPAQLKGSALKKTAQVTAGLVGAALAAPAGVVHGIVEGLGSGEGYDYTRQLLYTAGGLGVTLASWPLAFGLLMPAVLAAGVGGSLGLVSALVAGQDAMDRVPEVVEHVQRDNKVLGDDISNRRQKMFEGAFAGASVAAGVGWRKGATLFGAVSREGLGE